MSDESLRQNWRELLAKLGKRNFELIEMARLGFLDDESNLSGQELRELTEQEHALAEAEAALVRQLAQADSEKVLAGARDRRIARVRQASAARRQARANTEIEILGQRAQTRLEQPRYLGEGVSAMLKFDGGKPDRLSELGLPNLQGFLELASALGVTASQLHWLAFHREVATIDHYNRFEIPRRDGTSRLISAPKEHIASAQRWIRTEILSKLEPSNAAMAFRPGLSIVDNARAHTGAQVLVRIDIKDFFPSIDFPRVRKFFIQLGYNPGIATVLALLCTDAPRVHVRHGSSSFAVATGPRGLPQGASTSPDLANLIAQNLDKRIRGWQRAEGQSWQYTRYADDLVFSSKSSDADVKRLLAVVYGIIESEGWKVNHKKTSVRRLGSRMMVTGVAVDGDRIYLSRRDLRRIRAFLHNCETQGLDKVSEEIGKSAIAVARGYLAYVHMVMPEMARKLHLKYPWIS